MYKLTVVSWLLCMISAYSSGRDLKVTDLRCESKKDPLGVDAAVPHFSWKIQSSQRNTLQTAYHILVADDPALLHPGKANCWDSGKINSGASVQVPYGGRPVSSARTSYWKVRIWDNQGRVSGWSGQACWQAGLLTGTDWAGAQWIAYEKLPDTDKIIPAMHGKGDKSLGPSENILPLFRKTFSVKGPLKRATAFISGLGHFEMSLNGTKTGDHFLDPGWTMYDKEALYATFDITGQLKSGDNAVGVMLGNGFYYIPRDKRYRKLTGAFGYPKMICRLLLEYRDGTSENIVSDASWKTAEGPLTFSSIYAGEDYDARKESPGWDIPSFNDRGWKSVVSVDGPPVMKSQMADPLKVFESFNPVRQTEIRPGVWVYDLGQNASGIPRITVQGRKGDTVRIIPAELLADDGSASQKATGRPVYYDYILKGEGVETWQPRFTYYGFRYLQIEGAVPEGGAQSGTFTTLKEVRGLHTRNAAETAGEFTSSFDLFNRTYTLIDWAVRSNMVSIFTDCPHRERLGWQEQMHLMGGAVRYNYQILNLCKKVIGDMKAGQTPEGLVPSTVPEYTVMHFADGVFRDSPEWGSSSIILPWYLYQWYGDRRVLEENYPMMQRYAAYLKSKSSGFIISYGLSDWYDIGPERSGFSQLTPTGITATAYYYYDLTILQKIAVLLGRTEEAQQYGALAGQVKNAFNARFFDEDQQQYGTGSQAANAIAVYMGLVEPTYRQGVINNIVKDIRARNNSFTAGDIGYRYLLRVLTDEGLSDVIYDMNSRSDVPGYGYQLAKGATALTESWVASPAVSNNHFMLGHLQEWFYEGLAGIRQAENSVGFSHALIKPEPVGDVAAAAAKYESPYGLVSADWKRADNVFEISVTIPANSRATVSLPAAASSVVRESGRDIRKVRGIRMLGFVNGRMVLETGSGQYRFTVTKINQ